MLSLLIIPVLASCWGGTGECWGGIGGIKVVPVLASAGEVLESRVVLRMYW